jgi:hypothetical protein
MNSISKIQNQNKDKMNITPIKLPPSLFNTPSSQTPFTPSIRTPFTSPQTPATTPKLTTPFTPKTQTPYTPKNQTPFTPKPPTPQSTPNTPISTPSTPYKFSNPSSSKSKQNTPFSPTAINTKNEINSTINLTDDTIISNDITNIQHESPELTILVIDEIDALGQPESQTIIQVPRYMYIPNIHISYIYVYLCGKCI